MIELKFFISNYIQTKIHFKQQPLPKFWLLSIHCCLKRWSKCCYLLQQHMQNSIFSTYQNEDQTQMKNGVTWIVCIFEKNITKNWQFVPSKANILFTKCYYSVWILDDIFIKYLEKFAFFFFYKGSTRFYFYFYKGSRI